MLYDPQKNAGKRFSEVAVLDEKLTQGNEDCIKSANQVSFSSHYTSNADIQIICELSRDIIIILSQHLIFSG